MNNATMQQCGLLAINHFKNGFHCAEAVALAVLESHGVDPGQAVAHATPFGGGMGKTFCETCGAMSGGLIAIGHLHGRNRRGVDWDTPASMGRELRERFIKAYGDTNCGTLRQRFGEAQLSECSLVVKRVAEETFGILAD